MCVCVCVCVCVHICIKEREREREREERERLKNKKYLVKTFKVFIRFKIYFADRNLTKSELVPQSIWYHVYHEILYTSDSECIYIYIYIYI